MPKNKVEDLRNMLFETMERLMDPDDPMDVSRAKAVADVAQVVVNTAKVEINFVKHTGHGGTAFMGQSSIERPQLKSVGPSVKSLAGVSPNAYADLCTKCELPDCNESSPACLIQIERRKEAA